MKFIVKLFPEITIKSRPVRKRMIGRLQTNISIVTRRIDEEIKVKAYWDKIEVWFNGEDSDGDIKSAIVDALSRMPGIAHFLEVDEYPLGSFEEVFQLTKASYESRLAGKTFKVRVKRAGHHDFESPDLARYIGGGLLEHTEAVGVNLKNPDVWVDVEVKHDKVFIVSNIVKGLGGYPLGTQPAVLSLISGGFDSIVASYMTMRRGCKTHFLFFNLGGAAHEIGVKQVSLYLWEKYGSSARVKFISVPFDEVVGEIIQSVDNAHMGVILKRMMMRAAERVAPIAKAEALVTGESVAQVSSQTLQNLQLIDQVTEKLILRPLVVSDKQDIVNVAEEIGAADFAKAIPEYCGVISDKPTTQARPERIKEEEDNFDFEVLDRALERCEVISIDDIVKNVNAHADVESLSKVEPHQVIVDIRAPHEQEKRPLNMPGCNILCVPFYKLGAELDSFDPEKEYLLYCEKGVMSQLQASQAANQGRSNIKVFRPELDA
ncbi:MAG: tRNA uracil 4-sulfurtransferase ThiI [Pontibacterium sp.]